MTTTFQGLWTMMHAGLAGRFRPDRRGWALGLGIACGLRSRSESSSARASLPAEPSRSPIEEVSPADSVRSGVDPPALPDPRDHAPGESSSPPSAPSGRCSRQTIYGVRDVDPVALDTARSFGIGRFERLYRITLPSAVPYIATGLRISSAVALIWPSPRSSSWAFRASVRSLNVAESFRSA